ncbi:uncharacterized protein EV420DRAFT_1522115 [Desarmillaria tabescens]|uniref:Uncharacterized protein n=1 Tax=Armillaria tabescens TaxID=1929756 RepID=A0AA39NC87_ARMTA|nr:uncharacterized protein EV420DRAFT_1522115 [Desarmillaria tabescens]KAK0462991.1 hypothetical protein EV420DRAFT_1522115 [Desarmillaria tabescens]
MSTFTQSTESHPLGDAPTLPSVKDIDGMQPYTLFSQVLSQEGDDAYPVRVIQDPRGASFIAWKMAQIVVSALQNQVPNTLEDKILHDWIIDHFQLLEESTQDPFHIVLPTNGSVLCYRHEPGAKFMPVTCLDAIAEVNYVAHNADHDHPKEKATFVVVKPPFWNPVQTNPTPDFSQECQTCMENSRENDRPSNQTAPVATPARGGRREQQRRMLSVGRNGTGEDEDANIYKNKVIYQEDIDEGKDKEDDNDGENTKSSPSSGMTSEWSEWLNSRSEDCCFDMAPPTTLDEDDELPASQAMLEIENSGYERRYDDPPSDDDLWDSEY